MRPFQKSATTTTAPAFTSKAMKKVAPIWSDKRGTSAIEFAFFAGLLSVGLLNVVDISVYMYQRMEVENATEMGALAAQKTCGMGSLPATTNCPGLMTAVTSAVQSTSLGTKVALQSGSPSEGYYCVNSASTLQYVGGVDARPADCTAAGTPTFHPGDYIRISTTYSYQPMFAGITVAGMLATPITRTAWMRLD